MAAEAHLPRQPLGELLLRLRAVVQEQADALDQDDFERVAQIGAERDQLVAALDRYRPADFRPEDRAMLEQVGALDQRIIASVRASLDRANQERRTMFRGQNALQKYRQRGQAAIQALSRLNLEG